MTARFVPEKNHELIIVNLLEVLKENILTNVVIYFLENGPLKAKMVDIVKNTKYKNNFLFKETVLYNRVLNYFNQTDLVVIPSKSEGFRNIAIEAGLMRARILASDVGGLNQIIMHGKNGFKFKSESKEELKKELIEIVLNKKDLDREIVRQEMEDKFSFANMIEKYIKVIESV